VWLALGGGLTLAGAVSSLTSPNQGTTELFFWTQDSPAFLLCGLLVCVLRFLHPRFLAALAPGGGWGRRGLATIAVVAAAIGVAGLWVVFDGNSFSLDEFLADFDARIFAGGRLLQPLALTWRPYVDALQPIFMLPVPGHGYWASAYLPMNAAVRALAGLFHAKVLVNPAWSAVSILAIAAIARRLWPDRPGMAVGAALLLATSSQQLVMSMTAYAMPAHLALNLIWLWLVLRGGRLDHACAMVVAFVACGLHQIIFHPLFAAPFVLQLWLDRRWGAAVAHTLAYALIGLFWISYWSLVLKGLEVPAQSAAAVGGGWWLERVQQLLANVQWRAIGIMVDELLRFMTWQNIVAVPLAVLASAAAVRAGGVLRAMVLSVILTIVVIGVLLPVQIHGWGYRYLQGEMGSVCLVAIWGWTRLTDRLAADQRWAASAALGGACAVSLLVLFPFHAWQAHRYTHPYAMANLAVHRATSQVVIVANDSDNGSFDPGTVVRNDPRLEEGPKVLSLEGLDSSQIADICARYSVRLFDVAGARRMGVRVVPGVSAPKVLRQRAQLAALRCDRPL